MEFLPLCAVVVSSETVPPWLQSLAYVGHFVWSHPLSKSSDTWARQKGSVAAARRAVQRTIMYTLLCLGQRCQMSNVFTVCKCGMTVLLGKTNLGRADIYNYNVLPGCT